MTQRKNLPFDEADQTEKPESPECKTCDFRAASRFQPDPDTIGKPDQWLQLALRILNMIDREDVATGLEAEFDTK